MQKTPFILGVAVGYVLGARAGRERYEQIKRSAATVWTSDVVEQKKAEALAVARTKAAPYVADRLADAARAAGQALRESGSSVKHLKAVPSETVEDRPTGTDA
ncbi:hypothetical protein BN12_1950002 [Nostocoides japonicum T1-X7]|uniref:Protoporphyrinogen oxidase n=1 Tax=Nostocoides japonicum T1-X7 TaxID=1194083 RepID=A0A077LX25_9MICO|nr:hypothetical protein [Tetrasphaera japonica]CCH77427.1 hypothetical protein BN12_1950002 [Tetrasphaera japonica T1-X7]